MPWEVWKRRVIHRASQTARGLGAGQIVLVVQDFFIYLRGNRFFEPTSQKMWKVFVWWIWSYNNIFIYDIICIIYLKKHLHQTLLALAKVLHFFPVSFFGFDICDSKALNSGVSRKMLVILLGRFLIIHTNPVSDKLDSPLFFWEERCFEHSKNRCLKWWPSSHWGDDRLLEILLALSFKKSTKEWALNQSSLGRATSFKKRCLSK